MYYQGNLALKKKPAAEPVYMEKRSRRTRKKSIPTKEKLLYLFTIAICVMVAGLVILRYAQIYEINARLHTIEKEIKAVENENSTLKLEVNKLSNPERLAEKAKLQGLRPSEEQEVMEILNKSDLSDLHTVALKPN
jgi:cell division protein FtsL